MTIHQPDSFESDNPVKYSILRRKLTQWGVAPNKKRGQNFLVDRHIVDIAINALEIKPDDVILEIGAGAGALTHQLAQKAGFVVSIEIDNKLAKGLQEDLKNYKNIQVIHADALKLDWKQFIPPLKKGTLKITGNLPYSVTGPLLNRFLITKTKASKIVFMVQKEVALRILEQPGSKQYGSLSIISAYRSKVSLIHHVGKNCFWPVPKVDSSFLKFDLYHTTPFKVSSEERFFSIIRECFKTRRKMIKNALTNSSVLQYTKPEIQSALIKAEIEESLRPEDIDLSSYVRLAEALE
ncbi:MAG: 16S rRNA (adenine(1518)-N(6)/adenine(1519)-N(6))-dimethyltransferase RsmA [Candidatus Theseobacter exili]|nr:16S rRNA (adenine(1518)-N(6)/adenine(1519)-N(6))-dimethyltransferase RsmA [Candidatus Theseobacter exili]